MSTGVSIVGAGLSRFGRQPELHRARARPPGHRGRAARRRARVARRPGGVRRERRGRPGRHPGRRPRPDRDPLHQRQERLRDRGQRADVGGERDPVRRGRDRPGRGLRQAPAWRVRPATRGLGAARGVRRGRPDGDHSVLRHQDRPLPARAPHQRADPGPGGREGLPQRRAEPERLAPRADPGRRDRRRRHGQRPADPVDVLLTRARAAPRSSSPATPWPTASVARSACSARPPAPGGSAPSRSSAPRSRGPAARPASAPTPPPPRSRPPGVGPDEVDVAQLQDTESGAEVMHLAECGFCKDGEQEAMVAGGETEIDGRLPVNTDGGCIANGEPIGASGLRQVHEIVTQLRGEAGARQVAGPADRLHPRLRSPRHQRLHGAGGLSDDDDLDRAAGSRRLRR